MKIQHPWLMKIIGIPAAWTLRAWMATLRYQYRPTGASVDPHSPGLPGRYIYALWHENMLLPVYQYARPDISVLISQHRDAEILAEIIQFLRVRVVRGSTTRGGVEAVRRVVRGGQCTHLAMTPDGPRGPRRRVQPGVVYLAARTGMAIVPVGFGFDRPWRLRSWDCFALPRPGTRATCVTGAPIEVPPEVGKDDLEVYRRRVEESMLAVTDAAERWAETGVWQEAGNPIYVEPTSRLPQVAREVPA